jgi:hypothetical protein
MQANFGPLAADIDAPPCGTEPWFELGDNHRPASLAPWGGRWYWLQAQG